jgi:hypothetical protein
MSVGGRDKVTFVYTKRMAEKRVAIIIVLHYMMEIRVVPITIATKNW